MKIKLFLVVIAFFLLIQPACSSPEQLNKTPHIYGKIERLGKDGVSVYSTGGAIDSSNEEIILIVRPESKIFNQNDEEIKVEDLELGMNVKVWLIGGGIEDSYPRSGYIKVLKEVQY